MPGVKESGARQDRPCFFQNRHAAQASDFFNSSKNRLLLVLPEVLDVHERV